MTNKLFPVFDVPSTLIENVQRQKKYNPSPLWDFEKGDFVMSGTRQVIQGNGYDAWVLWCTKAIMTQRWAHYAYSGNAGIEAEQAFKEPDRGAVQSAFERTITEALLADPMGRTRQVRDFQFNWYGDSLSITCVVAGDDGNSATINVELKT